MNEPVQRNALPNFSGLLPKSSLCFLLWHQPEPANLNKECERERDFDRCPRLVNELVCSKISSSCTLRYFILHWCFLFVCFGKPPTLGLLPHYSVYKETHTRQRSFKAYPHNPRLFSFTHFYSTCT